MKTNAQKQTQNPNVLLHLVAIILIAITMISSSIGLYAWARYTSTQSSNATAQIAKWYFNLKTGQATIDGNTRTLLQLTRTDNREHVVEGKLAPGTYGVLPIIVDTTGTETDLTYDVLITINNCPQNMVFTPKTPASTTQTVAGDGTAQNPRVRTIRIQKYVPWSQTGEHDETISWDWPYETTSGNGVTANDDIDTADSGKEVTVTITAVGTEVLEEPQVRLDELTLKSNLFALETEGTSQTAQIEFESTGSVYNTETLTYTSNNANVATVSSTGLITAQGMGTTTITIAGRDSTKTVTVNVTLPIGATVNYTTSMNGVELNNWKLFYNDTKNNQVYLIYDDVIPNSVYKDSNDQTKTILKDTNKNVLNLAFNGDYNVYATDNRKTLLTAMENIANWASLTTGKMNAGTENEKSVTGIFAMGAPTLDLWKKSWNEKYPNNQIITGIRENMSDGLNGCQVANSGSTLSNSSFASLSNSDKLYFSRSSKYYWLASPSAHGTNFVMNVYSNGSVYITYYYSSDFGFRPVVCLPSSVLE